MGVGATPRGSCPKRVSRGPGGCAKSLSGDPNDPFRRGHRAPLCRRRRLLQLVRQRRADASGHRPQPAAHPGHELRPARDGHRGFAGPGDEKQHRADPQERLLHRRGRAPHGCAGRDERPGRRSRWRRAHQRQYHQYAGRRGGRGGLRPERRHPHRSARRRHAAPASLLARSGHGRGREPEDRRLAAGDVPRRRPGCGLQQRLRSARHRRQPPHLCSGGRRSGWGVRGGGVLRLLGERRHPDHHRRRERPVASEDHRRAPLARLVPLGPTHRRPRSGGDVRHPALPRRRAVLAGPAPRREHRGSEQGLRRPGGGERGADPVTHAGRLAQEGRGPHPRRSDARPSPTAAPTSPSARRPPGRVS